MGRVLSPTHRLLPSHSRRPPLCQQLPSSAYSRFPLLSQPRLPQSLTRVPVHPLVCPRAMIHDPSTFQPRSILTKCPNTRYIALQLRLYTIRKVRLEKLRYAFVDVVLGLQHQPVSNSLDEFNLHLRNQLPRGTERCLVGRRVVLPDNQEYREI